MESGNQKVILLVEDEALIAMSEAMTLEQYGFKVITVNSGEKAIETVNKTQNIDLILMDINLGKGMDGTQAAVTILKNHDIPLIFLSSHAEREVVEKTEGITSYGYIVKNSGDMVLIASIKMAFRLFDTHQKLAESEDCFRKVVEEAPIAMAIVGMDGVIEFINRKAVKVFGYMPEDIPNMDRWWAQAYTDEDYRREVISEWMARVQKAVTENKEITGNEYRVTCKNGAVKTMFISGAPVSGRIFVLFDDITERKLAEEALRESEERFSKAFKTSPYAYIIANMEDGAFIEVNDAFTTISGFSREEALASSTLKLNIWVHEEDRRRMVAALRESGAMEGMETKLRAKNGNIKTVLFSAGRSG